MSESNTNKIGVLLVNLGTPDQPDTGSVRRYLRQFLSDPRVIQTPRLIWWFILNGVILLFRPAQVAKLYKSVWTGEGSPLLVITRRQQQALQHRLQQDTGQNIPVVTGMTYGKPSIPQAIEQLQQQSVTRIVVLPMYPQYSATTTAAVFDAVAKALQPRANLPELMFIRDYWQETDYLDALAGSIQHYWSEHGKPDRLLLSFHGIPQSYEDKGDPYPDGCRGTAQAVADRLQLTPEQWSESFQSRFGRQEWVKPYTDHLLEKWGEDPSIGRVDVVCPAFSADCLETLEEIAEQNRDVFLEAGGESYHYIPCLNDDPQHIAFLARLVRQRAAAWGLNGHTKQN